MTVTVAGRRLTWSAVQIRLWPQIVQARIDRHDAAGIALDDPVTFAVAGATVLTAVVTAIEPNYRHRQIDVAPAILRHLALATIDAIPEGTSQQASALAQRILGVEADFDGGTDIMLPRWSTRPRGAGWAWESLIATIGDRMGEPVTWRYSARDDLIIVEPDRSGWSAQEPPTALRREGAFTVYPEADLQAGDAVDGRLVEHVETITTADRQRTVARSVPA